MGPSQSDYIRPATRRRQQLELGSVGSKRPQECDQRPAVVTRERETEGMSGNGFWPVGIKPVLQVFGRPIVLQRASIPVAFQRRHFVIPRTLARACRELRVSSDRS